MKLLKPAFVHNQERPIFSIDIHPKEAKFATVQKKKNSKIFPAFIFMDHFYRAVKEMTPDVSPSGIWNQFYLRKPRWIQMFLKFYAKCEISF